MGAREGVFLHASLRTLFVIFLSSAFLVDLFYLTSAYSAKALFHRCRQGVILRVEEGGEEFGAEMCLRSGNFCRFALAARTTITTQKSYATNGKVGSTYHSFLKYLMPFPRSYLSPPTSALTTTFS